MNTDHLIGSGPPLASMGNEGDYYTDRLKQGWIYGPKTGDVWPLNKAIAPPPPAPVAKVTVSKALVTGLVLIAIVGGLEIYKHVTVPATDDTPAIILPFKDATIVRGDLLEIKAKAVGKIKWSISPKDGLSTVKINGNTLYFSTKADTAEYVASAETVVNGEISTPEEIRIMVGQGPQPPPNPNVIPNPPTPSAAPIPVAGFRVLIVENVDDRSKLPPAQAAILTSKTIRDYFAAHCVKGPDGKTPEARIWYQGADVSKEAKLWQDAFARPRGNLPWIIISDGNKGFEGPLPSTVADTITLLQKYGGQ